MYVDILRVLACDGSPELTHKMHKANTNCSVLKKKLEFLMDQNLIEEKAVEQKRIVYAITRRGTIVLKHFRELKTVESIVKKAQGKHFHKDSFSNVQSRERKIIRNFIKILSAAGGVMDNITYLDLINETRTGMNLDQIEEAELFSIRAHMEEMGHLKRTTDTETELWVLTLEGLKFAQIRSQL
jgi:predicted transcriptional regulator